MRIFILCVIVLCAFQGTAQKGKSYFGFQLKPIIPNKFIGQFKQPFNYDSIPRYEGSIDQKPGFVFGMVLRHGISKNISIESGINYSRRNYDISYVAEDSGIAIGNDLRLINYDIPINALIYIQLSDAWYMNASAGINMSFYPTSVFTQAPLDDIDNQFYQIGFRSNWVKFGINANYGFEYRAKKLGIFYAGASYNLPFGEIMNFTMTWKSNNINYQTFEKIDGSYLTLDFKYFIGS